jgi:outer membrane protein insertion porin family
MTALFTKLRTKPGEKYSKDLLVRTVREIGQLGFFDPEAIIQRLKMLMQAGTVDIEYQLVEKDRARLNFRRLWRRWFFYRYFRTFV